MLQNTYIRSIVLVTYSPIFLVNIFNIYRSHAFLTGQQLSIDTESYRQSVKNQEEKNQSKLLNSNNLALITFFVTIFRDQREREEDIYEVKPSTIVLRKKKNVPRITELIMQQRNKQEGLSSGLGNKHTNGCTTCIRCHRPKMLL